MAFSGLIKCSGYMSFFHDVIIFALGNSADEFLLLKVKGYVYRFCKIPYNPAYAACRRDHIRYCSFFCFDYI